MIDPVVCFPLLLPNDTCMYSRRPIAICERGRVRAGSRGQATTPLHKRVYFLDHVTAHAHTRSNRNSIILHTQYIY